MDPSQVTLWAALTLLAPISIAIYKSRREREQRVADWRLKEHYGFYVKARAHYGNVDRLRFLDDQSDPKSRDLISQAKLLNVPEEIVRSMEAEDDLRADPERMKLALQPPHVVLWHKGQGILRAMEEDVRVNINGKSPRERYIDAMLRIRSSIETWKAQYRANRESWWIFAILPSVSAVSLTWMLF